MLVSKRIVERRSFAGCFLQPQETLNEPTIVPDNTDNEDKGEKSLDTLQSHSAVDELINVSDGPSCNERINHEGMNEH